MQPAILAGDWLLIDPTVRTWPRNGSVVVFHEPDGGPLAIKRVEAGPGERIAFAGGYLVMGPDEAWLTADASTVATGAAGLGPPVDSHRFGPVSLQHLVGRAFFRYAPLGRLGRIPARYPRS
jgi:signal peptidase I